MIRLSGEFGHYSLRNWVTTRTLVPEGPKTLFRVPYIKPPTDIPLPAWTSFWLVTHKGHLRAGFQAPSVKTLLHPFKLRPQFYVVTKKHTSEFLRLERQEQPHLKMQGFVMRVWKLLQQATVIGNRLQVHVHLASIITKNVKCEYCFPFQRGVKHQWCWPIPFCLSGSQGTHMPKNEVGLPLNFTYWPNELLSTTARHGNIFKRKKGALLK